MQIYIITMKNGDVRQMQVFEGSSIDEEIAKWADAADVDSYELAE